MTRRSVLIVDDEPLARTRIRSLLEKAPDKESFLIGEAVDGVMALEMMHQDPPDIVFLDIQMPEFTGFDVLTHLEKPPKAIIFQTAYDEYAVRAFEFAACDYLLKPFSNERFYQALERGLEHSVARVQAIQNLVSHLQKNHAHYMVQVAVRVGHSTRIFQVDEVEYFFSQDHCTTVHLGHTSYALDYSLNFLESHLNPLEFIRVHRNAIVRLSSIQQFNHTSPMTIVLHSGAKLKVSRERRKQLLSILKPSSPRLERSSSNVKKTMENDEPASYQPTFRSLKL